MAKPKPKKPKPKPISLGDRKSQQTQKPKSKPKTTQEQKQDIKQTLKDELQGKVFQKGLQAFGQRQNIRSAMTVGNFDDWRDEYENGYQNSSPLIISKDLSKPYGEPRDTRPRLKIVSRREA